jgi:L-asparaginase
MKIVLFTLGGTIASTAAGTTAAGTTADGVIPQLAGADLLASVPGLDRAGADLRVRDFRQTASSSLTIADVVDLVRAIRAEVAAGAAGVVVSQGTDTIEETAFLADLLYAGDVPVVFTGAMRNPTLAGPDGPANLRAAVTVATSPDARGLGCVVVFSDEIHAARFVRKAHTTSVGAFVSPLAGPLGIVAEDRVVLLTRPPRWPALPDPRPDPLPGPSPGPLPGPPVRIGLVTMVLGDDGTLLEAAADRFSGLVVAGFGGGHVPAPLADVLDETAQRIPVVLASRTGAGMVLANTYAYPGSELDLRPRGLIGAGFLDPIKARLLLHVLLAGGADRAGIAAAFASFGADLAGPA